MEAPDKAGHVCRLYKQQLTKLILPAPHRTGIHEDHQSIELGLGQSSPTKKLITDLLKKAAKTNYVRQELVTFTLPFWGHALCILIVIAIYDATGDDKHVLLARL
jgi:hypothetical protein